MGGGPDTGVGGTTGSGGAVPTSCSALPADPAGLTLVTADPANNYAFSSTLTLHPTEVAPMGELHFDWSGLSQDFLGHAMAPTDVQMLTLVVWKLTLEELQQKLNDDVLEQRDNAGIAILQTGGTRQEASLLEFTAPGGGTALPRDQLLGYLNPEALDPTLHTYTLMAGGGTAPGQDTRMLKAFQVSPTSQNTEVVMDSTSTGLTYNVNMQSLVPTFVPAGSSSISVDWSYLTMNAMGQTILPQKITRVLVSHYTQTPAELESLFLDLNLIAVESWSSEVPDGTSLALSSLTSDGTATGTPFPGISGEGTWILALQCGSCRNPAPWYLTVLLPCAQ